jgi:hypothetical protein
MKTNWKPTFKASFYLFEQRLFITRGQKDNLFRKVVKEETDVAFKVECMYAILSGILTEKRES